MTFAQKVRAWWLSSKVKAAEAAWADAVEQAEWWGQQAESLLREINEARIEAAKAEVRLLAGKRR